MLKKVEISHRTIVFTVFFLLFLWFLYYIRDTIFLFFLALLVMTIFDPTVRALGKFKIPRALSILICYIIAFTIVGGALVMILPPLVDETSSLVTGLPTYLGNLGIAPTFSQEALTELLTKLGSLPGQLLKFGISLFSNIFGVITVLVLSFYLLLSREKLDEQLGVFFGEEKKKELRGLIDELETRLGGWARGQLLLMFLVGVANFIGLTLLGIPFALPLALLAGILEIIPYLGPIIAAIPAVIIGFGISVPVGLGVVILALLIQQIEASILVPKIVQKSVGIAPIITLLALIIGGKLFGVTGMLISIPLVITLQVLTKRYFVV